MHHFNITFFLKFVTFINSVFFFIFIFWYANLWHGAFFFLIISPFERTFTFKVHNCVAGGGKVLIPTFALGRAQVSKIFFLDLPHSDSFDEFLTISLFWCVILVHLNYLNYDMCVVGYKLFYLSESVIKVISIHLNVYYILKIC